MKAVAVMGPDFTPGLVEVEEPTVAPDGVVVQVLAASVNDVDRAAVDGRHVGSMSRRDPVLLGRDFVGRVTAVGSGVDYIEVGMSVAGALSPESAGRSGTFTDRVAVAAGSVAPVPDGIDLAHVAAVGLAGLTAMAAINALGAARLGNLLIVGPVSEAGGYALQLAKAHGAVVAVLTPASQVELAWGLGADVVIAQGPDSTRSIRAVRDFFGGGVDTAIHLAGDPTVATGVLRQGGRFTVITDTTTSATHGVGSPAGYVATAVAPNGHELADLLFKLAADKLHSQVARILSFDQIGDAFNPANTDTAGRTIITR
jgi:NADPH:quinone reductase-like Zn-dependent oxidoreductase